MAIGHTDDLPMAAVHHDITYLGARMEEVNGKKVAAMYFGCCLYPVKVIVVDRETLAAQELGKACAITSDVQGTKVIGKYLAAVVGKHEAFDLVKIFGAVGFRSAAR